MPRPSRIAPGQHYGRLVVVKENGRCRQERAWLCRCECGSETTVASYPLASGATKSCGCRKGLWKHGYARRGQPHTPEYQSWQSMMTRCYSESHIGYSLWGGRGITVCDRWRNDFVSFLADMGPRPPGTTIDRINNDGNYEPSNCRWATRIQQMTNTRRSQWYRTLDDGPITLSEMARQLAMPRGTLQHRLININTRSMEFGACDGEDQP